MGECHFGIDAVWLIDTVRQMYWQENKVSRAKAILNDLEGITDDQIMALLNGKVYLTPDYEYVPEDDIAYLRFLDKHKIYLAENYYQIFERWIDKDLLSAYIIQTCLPLIRLVKNSKFVVGHSLNIEERITELFDSRGILLERLLKHAGFDQYETGYAEFVRELDHLTDMFAGNVVNAPNMSHMTIEEEELFEDLRNVLKYTNDNIVKETENKIKETENKIITDIIKNNMEENDEIEEAGSTIKNVDEVISKFGYWAGLHPERIMKIVNNKNVVPVGNGYDFFQTFANTLHMISISQHEQFYEKMSNEEYINKVTPLCLDLLDKFITAIISYNHKYDVRFSINNDDPIPSLFYDLCNGVMQLKSNTHRLSGSQDSAVLLFERMRGFIHANDELSLKFLKSYPITDDIVEDRRFVALFHDTMNKSTGDAKALLERYVSGESVDALEGQ